MIISATRITTASGAGKVGGHVFSGLKNERIECVRGSRDELDDMVGDARAHGAKYAIRHFSISPERAATRDQALEIVRDLAEEFGFDPERAVVVEHQKKRADGAGYDKHWHAMAPEVDPVKGRVLDDKWMRARHEKVARVAEIRLGHDAVSGRFNASVERALRADGRDLEADRVADLVAADRPKSAFTSAAHQAAQRQGRSLPDDRATVRGMWRKSDTGQAFAAAIADAGLTIASGKKEGVYVIERDGELVGAVDRLVGDKRDLVAGRLAGVDFAASRTDAQQTVINQTGEQLENELAKDAIGEENDSRKKEQTTVDKVPYSPDIKIENSQSNMSKSSQSKIELHKEGIRDDSDRTVAHATTADKITPASGGDVGETARTTVDGRRDSGDRRWDFSRGSSLERQKGPDIGDGGSAHRSGAERQAPAVTRPSHADTDRERADEAVARPSRENRRVADPYRVAAGRTRIAARRAEITLADACSQRTERLQALTDALTTPRARALRVVVAEEHRIANDRAPWPNRSSLDTFDMERQFAAQVHKAQADRQKQLEAVRRRVGLIDRALAIVGVATPRVKLADKLFDEWSEGKRTLDAADTQARRAGRAEAYRRQDEQSAWQRRHDSDVETVRLVRDAVERGDEKITGLVARCDYRSASHLAHEQERKRVEEAVRQRQAEEAQRQAAVEAQRRIAAARAPKPAEPTYTGPRFR